jgi:hypothetical protein
LGAQSACQEEKWKPGNPASSVVGMSEDIASRVLAVTAWALMLPARVAGKETGADASIKSICPPTKSCIA